MGAEVYIAHSGKFSDRGLWALVDGDTEAVRGAAVMLYQDMRTRQQEAGHEPTAAVWIGGKLFEPTIEELEAHDERVRIVMENEKNLPDSIAEIAMSVSTEELSDIVEDCPDESEVVEEEEAPPDVVGDFDLDFEF